MTAILNYLTLAMWEDFTPSDVQEELRDMRKFKESRRQGLGWYMIVSRPPELPDPILHSEVGIRVLSHHNYWHSLVEDATPTTVRNLEDSISSFRRKKFDRAINLRFFVPFGIVGKLWAHPNPTVQEESLSLIQLYRDSWDAYSGPEEKGDERLAFLVALTKHLKLRGNDGVHRSCLLTGVQVREFIQFIRSEIIRRRLNECPYWEPDQSRRRALIETWNEATRNVTGLTPIPVPETVSSFTSVEVSNHGGTTDLGDTSIEV
ncbi:hypothetical protein MPER_05624 [Moniliophthora perniciosa FA553]|nr:hypothetical protein MPER_05624 [Moniliophthora perniciosa FA553]